MVKELIRDAGHVLVARYSDDSGTPQMQIRSVAAISIEHEGRTVKRRTVRKTSDTLDRMLNAKAIGRGQYDAGRKFEQLAYHASLNRSSSVSFDAGERTGNPTVVADGVLDARQRLRQVIDRLGGISSVQAVVCWYVLGCGLTFKDVRWRVGNKRLSREMREALSKMSKMWGYA